MDYAYIFRKILKKKWIILGSGLLAAIITYYVMGNEKKKYRSFAQVSTGFVIHDEINILNNTNISNDPDAKFNNAIATANSPTVLSLVSYQLILHDLNNPKPFRTLTKKQKESPVYQGVNITNAKSLFESKLLTMKALTSFDPEEKKLLEFLGLYGYTYKSVAKMLSVSRMDRTDYIQFECFSENPELSAFVANTAFHEFLRYSQTSRSNRSQESIDTLQSLLEKKKQEADAKNALLRNTGVIDVDITGTSSAELITNLETKLSDENNKLTNLNYDLQKVNGRLNTLAAGKISTDNNSAGDPDNDEIIALKKARDAAFNAWTSNGSKDQDLYNKYNNLKIQYQNKVASLRVQNPSVPDAKSPSATRAALLDQKTDLEFAIKASTSSIASLQSKINALKGNLSSDASKNSYVKSLMRDADLANKEYLEVKQKYNEAIDITSASLTNFRQILMAQPAIEPEPSKRLLMVVGAGIGTLLTVLCVIVLLTYLDSSIRTPGIFSRMINLKLICMVNFMDLKNRNLANIIASKDDANDSLEKKRHNTFRESLRKLRYEIERTGQKIFLFTSTQKGQGKTTLVQALSYSLSMSKKKVLIIDTNFCNNDLTVQLNAKPILEKIDPIHTSGKSLLEKIKNVANTVGVPGVYVIGSEGGDYTPSEILPRENLLQHLHELTNDFDFIFLEGPPLNDYSDSKELTQYVDGVIGIFSAKQIVKQTDKESLNFYKELNGKFYGAVLNMVDLENVNVK